MSVCVWTEIKENVQINQKPLGFVTYELTWEINVKIEITIIFTY